ncbi:MAG TPA: CPBP family glutamic-type intramembrane protease [Bacteroidales bacterium]|nr:CPBP family glutamic-type intramembrane protease [Bacteroidales bacterium]
MTFKIKLGLTLFALGALGILSLLTVSIPLDNLPKQVLDKFTPETIKLLTLIKPAILLLVSVVIGTILFEKVKLTVPTITSLLKSENEQISFLEQIKFGVILGLITGILTITVGIIFKSSLPQEFVELGNKIKITIIARFAYGGLTEELLMRFGFMTLIVWLVFKMTKQLNSYTYWTGIILATILFAFGHFPVAFSVVSNPTISLLTYILVGNSIAGIFFGWLYWKKGLEAAFVGHIFAHVAMLVGEQLFRL